MQLSFFPVGILMVCGTGVGLVILANFVFYSILCEVNGRSSPDQQISMLGVNVKLFFVMRRHAELFPNSGKRLQIVGFPVAGFALVIAGLLLGVIHYSGQP